METKPCGHSQSDKDVRDGNVKIETEAAKLSVEARSVLECLQLSSVKQQSGNAVLATCGRMISNGQLIK